MQAKAFDLQKMGLSLLQMVPMKTIRFLIILSATAFFLSSCSVFSKPKYGCGDNGKNVGAEKIIDGTSSGSGKKFKA